eukprot:TRINITY_DN2200_c0_g1_i1.p1 TRINITY_DN2200_c0_g1~~TRINITY_DN2200_c0_g1_i1.p1  ORF type:complete len:183 (+),score=18.74 TRINITY_DN2200_c0_g1_i1:99-647(+)
MIRRPPRSTLSSSSAASDVYKRQVSTQSTWGGVFMIVKNIMSKDVVSLNSDDSVERAAQIMNQYNVGSVPVCNNQKLVGIVTDRDITLRSVATSGNISNKKIGDVMTPNPVTATADMDIHDAARIMSQKQIRRLPIVENNNLVGIVSLGDISVEPSLQDNAEEALKNISKSQKNIYNLLKYS